MVCANFCEISRSFLRESSRLRIFVREGEHEKRAFSWADLDITATGFSLPHQFLANFTTLSKARRCLKSLQHNSKHQIILLLYVLK